MKVDLYADGGSRGNPGVAGSGSCLKERESGDEIYALAYAVSTQATNNVAEYHGLIQGLLAAQEFGATEVAVYMDSKLVVEQMSGRWKVKHPDMQQLARRAFTLMASFDSVTLTWIPRKQNSRADELANIAMDAVAEKSCEIPGIVQVFRDDKKDSAPLAADTNSPAKWRGDASAGTTLILLRHGQTEMSAQSRYSGLRDVPLTDLGLQQAHDAAQLIAQRGGIDRIVCSPLGRARQTAEAVATLVGLPVEIDEALIEMDFGDWEGKTFAEARTQDPELHQRWLDNYSVATPGGESLSNLDTRLKRWRRGFVKENAGKTVVLVSHVGPIKSLIRQALGAGENCYSTIFLDLASISIVEFSPESSHVRAVNVTPKLPTN